MNRNRQILPRGSKTIFEIDKNRRAFPKKFVPFKDRKPPDNPRLAVFQGGSNAKRKQTVSLPKLKCLEEPK
jgi:hypothetical protein